MRKEEFLTALRAELTGLSPEGVEKLVEFCSEMIDDRMEDGLTEEEAVAAAGSLDELIQQAKTELLPVKTANFTERSTFGDTLRTYTAESSICGIIANCDYTADFKLLPSENGTCRVECMESEKICYSVTTENNVLHIECADRRTLFSRYKFSKAQRHATVRVYLPQGTYKSLEVETTSGDIAIPAGYAFDTASLQSTSGDIACCAECSLLSIETTSGDIALKNAKCSTIELCSTSGDITLENVQSSKKTHAETTSGKVQFINLETTELEIHTASGKVSSENIKCTTLQIGTASGEVHLTHVKSSNTIEVDTASGKVSLENTSSAVLHVDTISGEIDLTRAVSSNSMEIGTISSNIHLESCDSESLLFESRSGSIIGTLNTGKNFYITSRNNKVDVPFDSGEGTCEIETRSGSIRVKITE